MRQKNTSCKGMILNQWRFIGFLRLSSVVRLCHSEDVMLFPDCDCFSSDDLAGHLRLHLAVEPWPRPGRSHRLLHAHCHLQNTAVGRPPPHVNHHTPAAPPSPESSVTDPMCLCCVSRPTYSLLGHVPDTDLYRPLEEYNQVPHCMFTLLSSYRVCRFQAVFIFIFIRSLLFIPIPGLERSRLKGIYNTCSFPKAKKNTYQMKCHYN